MTKKNKTSNRDVVLQLATELFLQKGYLATGMDEIVALSKVSKTNIYYHFASKEELLAAIIHQLITQYSEKITHIATQHDQPVWERLQRFTELLIMEDVDCLGGCPFLTLYTQTPIEAEHIRYAIKHFFEQQVIVVEQLIVEGIQRKEFNESLQPPAVASLIISTIEGGLFLGHVHQNPQMIRSSLFALAAMLK